MGNANQNAVLKRFAIYFTEPLYKILGMCYTLIRIGALAKLAIALHWQCRDHRFESGKLHH